MRPRFVAFYGTNLQLANIFAVAHAVLAPVLQVHSVMLSQSDLQSMVARLVWERLPGQASLGNDAAIHGMLSAVFTEAVRSDSSQLELESERREELFAAAAQVTGIACVLC